MKKRILGVALAGVLAVSALAGSVMTASAASEDYLGEYKPSAGVETRKVYFAMPGAWTNDVTKTQNDACGIYWWGGSDEPDKVPAANGHGWPGYKMINESEVVNLRSTLMAADTPNIIFSNYIDGGMDVTAPEFTAAKQIVDTQIEYFQQGDSDYMPLEFWDYLYDTYYEDFCDDPNYQIEEFGGYAQNFFYSEDDDNISHYIDNMIYVVDLDNIKMSYTIVPEGMPSFCGSFYFYYGNGEFGVWPTKELLTEHEGVQFDEDGKAVLENETVNKWGFVTRNLHDAYTKEEKEMVVYGNITGNYWAEKDVEIPTVDPATITTTAPATTIPDAENNDATSASGSASDSSTGSNNSNGSIATGEASTFAFVAVAIIAALGVFYFVRRRRSSK